MYDITVYSQHTVHSQPLVHALVIGGGGDFTNHVTPNKAINN